jgi:iron complex transport system ATP-binding protein
MKLDVRSVNCGYEHKSVIQNISFSVSSGEVLCLLGPNGVGKTTLFKTIMGFMKPQAGEILLDGKDISAWPAKKLAKEIGYVPQAHVPSFPFSVYDVVVMGRTVHMGMFGVPSPEDARIAEEALKTLNILFLRDCIYTEISGGERQLVLIARALAQNPSVLIMDEPTSSLDYGNQIKVLEQVSQLSKLGLGVIMTSHSPNHAFLCATKIVLMQGNNTFCIGSVQDVLTEENLRLAYGPNITLTDVMDKKGRFHKRCVPFMGEEFSRHAKIHASTVVSYAQDAEAELSYS